MLPRSLHRSGSALLLLGLAILLAPRAVADAPAWRDEAGFRAVERLRRGVNLGNAWEAPPGTWGDRRYGPEDFREIRAAGFDHVRMPVAWHHYLRGGPEWTIDAAIFREIDRLIDEARRARLHVVLNWHHFDALTEKTAPAEIARWHAGWDVIARHYKHVPDDELVFELLNEPRDAATTERMNELYPAAVAVVRAVSPGRTILVSPGNWGALKAVPQLSLPRDLANLVVTGHTYEPFLFTHQGASWTGKNTATTGIAFPGPPEKPVAPAEGVEPWVADWIARHNTLPPETNPGGPSAYAEIFAAAAEWGRREGRAIHVGEFGAIVHADPASRARYASAVRAELDRHGFAWAWWDWKAAFAASVETPEGVRMDPALRAALFPVPPPKPPATPRGPRRR